jgi:hypothetical protein
MAKDIEPLIEPVRVKVVQFRKTDGRGRASRYPGRQI